MAIRSFTGTSDLAAGFARVVDTPMYTTFSVTANATGTGGARTISLSQAQDNNIILLDVADCIVNLPASPTVGTTYTFVSTVSSTATGATAGIRILTSTASVFFGGSVSISGPTAPGTFGADATATTAIRLGGTQGGVVGSTLTIMAISATVWVITASALVGTTTAATPFSTTRT